MWIISKDSATNTDHLTWLGKYNGTVVGAFADGTETNITLARDFDKIIQGIKNGDDYVEVSL